MASWGIRVDGAAPKAYNWAAMTALTLSRSGRDRGTRARAVIFGFVLALLLIL